MVGSPARLETNLILPSALGFHIAATLYIEYANTGGAPMPAPLLKLHGSQHALLTVDEAMAGSGLWTENPPLAQPSHVFKKLPDESALAVAGMRMSASKPV